MKTYDEILEAHGVVDDGDAFRVVGRPYRITATCPEFMNENVHVWACTCPAGQYGRDCKHVRQVQAALDAAEAGDKWA